MTRTKEEIKEELVAEGPDWLFGSPLGKVIANGLASVLERVEGLWADYFDQLFRQTADERYLEDLGENTRGVERQTWETVSDYREEAVVKPKAPTPARLEDHIERLLKYQGYDAYVVEPRMTTASSIDDSAETRKSGLFTDDPYSALSIPDYKRQIVVDLPLPEATPRKETAIGNRSTPVVAKSLSRDDATPGSLLPEPSIWSRKRQVFQLVAEYLETYGPQSTAIWIRYSDRHSKAYQLAFSAPQGIL